MTENELLHTLALLQVHGVGNTLAKRLLQKFGSAQSVFEASKYDLAQTDGIGKAIIENLQNKTVFQKAEAELRFVQSNNITPFFYKNDNYPSHLKNCFDTPILLFGSGNMNIENQKIISIVGTRNITNYGTEVVRKIISDLQPLNPVIVSGFAYGVDITAHTAAIENGLQTVGVLAHGLNQIYPKIHEKYKSRMEENGGFLTEFFSTSKPDKENFVKRNCIVAGIAEAVVVIESAEKGGSLITARIASDYSREVFAIPGKVTDKYSEGCNNLIKTHQAQAITSAADLIYLLGWELSTKPTKKQQTIQKQIFVELSAEEKNIYDFLSNNGKELLDIIAQQCELPVFKVSSALLNMELKGVVRSMQGKIFEVV